MNTSLIHWQQYNRPLNAGARRPALKIYQFMDKTTSYLASALTAVGVVIAAAWLITNPAMVLYLQATVWTAGLVFMGLAIDAEKLSTTRLAIATGIALPALAYLSKQFGPELLVVAAFLVGAWLAAALYGFTRTARR